MLTEVIERGLLAKKLSAQVSRTLGAFWIENSIHTPATHDAPGPSRWPALLSDDTLHD